MHDKSPKKTTDEEYVEVSLGEYLYYSKVVRFCFALIVILGIVAGFVYQANQIQDLNSKIEELAKYDGYDFETHSAAQTMSEIETRAEQLRNTDWFKKNITKSNLKSDVFGYKDKSYYVMFYKDDCGYCNQIESSIYKDMRRFEKSKTSLYWCNVETAGDVKKKSDIKKKILWTDDKTDDSKYSISKDKFVISGTPTLVKISKGNKNLEVFVGADEIKKELNVE